MKTQKREKKVFQIALYSGFLPLLCRRSEPSSVLCSVTMDHTAITILNAPKCFSSWKEIISFLCLSKAKRLIPACFACNTGYETRFLSFVSVLPTCCISPPHPGDQNGFSGLLLIFPSGEALQITLFVFLHRHPGRLTWS